MLERDHESVRRTLVAMLRRCADIISELPCEDVSGVLDGELELRISLVNRKAKRKRPTLEPLGGDRLDEIVKRLTLLDSRVQGEQLLQEVAPTKARLEAIARKLDVPVRREDRQDDLARRIIEATIGFRITSATIQGRSTARNRDQGRGSFFPTPKKG